MIEHQLAAAVAPGRPDMAAPVPAAASSGAENLARDPNRTRHDVGHVLATA